MAGDFEATGRAWSSVAGARDNPTDDELDFSVVVGRKRQIILTNGYNAASRDLTDSDNTSKPSTVPGKRRLHLTGTAPSSTLLKAAKDLTKKEVFCISNAANDATCDSIVSFVKSIKVKVLSCFDAKTRVPDTKAFRICIDKADRRKFLNKNNWPCNISVCQW